MSDLDAELLANKAGLSLENHENILAPYLRNCGKAARREIYFTVVCERMVEMYISGMEPTKEILLAIFILLEVEKEQIEELLKKYGYALSRSLPNDAIVRWHLQSSKRTGLPLLNDINDTLGMLGFPLLTAKCDNS